MLRGLRSSLRAGVRFLRKKLARLLPRRLTTEGRLSLVRVVDLPELQTIAGASFAAGANLLDQALLRQAMEPALTRMRSKLPRPWMELTKVDLVYVFASTVAHNLKPYGRGCPSQQLQALLQAPYLDCSNYGLLAYYASLVLVDETDRRLISIVGWDGGVIGNHQMLFVRGQGAKPSYALDPTLGVACLADFDQVTSGQPIPPDAVAIIGAKPQLKDSRETFVRALLEGQFRPSDLLYYFHTVEDYLNRYGNPFDWPTPAAAVMRARYSSSK